MGIKYGGFIPANGYTGAYIKGYCILVKKQQFGIWTTKGT